MVDAPTRSLACTNLPECEPGHSGNAVGSNRGRVSSLDHHKHCAYTVIMLMTLIQILEDAGVRTDVTSDRQRDDSHPDALITLKLEHSEAHLGVEARRRAPYPGEIASLEQLRSEIAADGIPTLVAPYISEETGRQLTNAGWCWADAQGNADLRAPGLRIQRRTTNRSPVDMRDRLPLGVGSLSIIRTLITTGECPGPTQLAQAVGVTQPRASQVLDRLTRSGLVDREDRTTWTVHRAALLDAFLSQYRGPGGSEHRLYTLGPLEDAAHDLAEASRRATGSALSLSGDVAADRISPWRRPTTLLVYAPTPFSTSALDMVEARGSHDANVVIRYPDDRSLFKLDPIDTDSDLRLVDPTQIIWDLVDLGGSDRREAADKVAAWLLSR